MRKEIDVFPAIVKLAFPGSLSDYTSLQIVGPAPQGTRRLDRCRVVVLGGLLMIAEDSPEGPKLVFREKVSEISQENKTTHLLTESGKIVAVIKDHNCGCGSRLRSWNPYGSHISSSQDPQ